MHRIKRSKFLESGFSNYYSGLSKQPISLKPRHSTDLRNQH